MSHFVYRSLTPNFKRIRLVRVLPESHNEASARKDLPRPGEKTSPCLETAKNLVCCEIYHVSLDDAPPYCALSYYWGDPTPTQTIIVNGAHLSITENLDVVLRHLRLSDKPIVLWIDALCINQGDDLEKTEQIQQMRQIYSQASSVVAWLGPSSDESEIAMKWMQKYGERAHNLGVGTTYNLQLHQLLTKRASRGDDKNHTVNEALWDFVDDLFHELLTKSTPTQSSIVAALTHLFKRPYWSRIWIVQELVSASSMQFVCGKDIITEDAFHHALRLLRNARQHQIIKTGENLAGTSGNQFSLFGIETRNPVLLLKFRRARGPFPLIYLLRSLWRFSATDPRDKAFALYGISSDIGELGLKPDYQKSCFEVYTNVAEVFLRRGYYEFLSFCHPFRQIADLPSWVPDLSVIDHRRPLQQRSLTRNSKPLKTTLEPCFEASNNVDGVSILPPEISSDDAPSFHCKGVILGTVEQLGTAWNEGGIAVWFQDLQNFSLSCSEISKVVEDRQQMVWRTAVADQEIRRGTAKPRLSEPLLASIHEALRNKDLKTLSPQTLIDAGLGDYLHELNDIARGRMPLLITGHYIAIGPEETLVGDELAIFTGAQTPYLLRRRAAEHEYHFVGETYVHGIMDGHWLKPTSVFKTIILV